MYSKLLKLKFNKNSHNTDYSGMTSESPLDS